jgi:2'-5' RNA ligase
MQELSELIALLKIDIMQAEKRGFLPANLAILKLLVAAHERLDELYGMLQEKTVLLQQLQEDQHTSIMIGFWPNEETAQALALPGGEDASELHITLCYLGSVEDNLGNVEHLKEVVAQFAGESISSLRGTIGGIGRFNPSEYSENLAPIVALINATGLQKFRVNLASRLSDAGLYVANNFGDYLPHITLAYIDPDAPMPIQNIEALPLTFDTLWLCIGDERIPFKLGSPPAFSDQTYSVLMTMLDRQGKAIEAVALGNATLDTIGDPLDLSDEDLDTLSQITDDDLKNAVKLWDDNAPEGFGGMLNAGVGET